MFTKWNKAVIFNEKTIIAKKNCNTSMQQLGAYFKAYESRDNTIGQGTTYLIQGSCCRAIISMCTGSIPHLSMAEEAMLKTARVSAWLLVKQSKGKKSICLSPTSSQSSQQELSHSKLISIINSVDFYLTQLENLKSLIDSVSALLYPYTPIAHIYFLPSITSYDWDRIFGVLQWDQ